MSTGPDLDLVDDHRDLEAREELWERFGDRSVAERALVFLNATFIPRPIPGVSAFAINAGAREWPHQPGRITYRRWRDHLTGVCTLGAVCAGDVHYHAVDVDNAIGRYDALQGHARIRFDDDFPERMAIAERLYPKGHWIRSSSSGGMHLFQFFTQAHPQAQLGGAAALRLRELVEGLTTPFARRAARAGYAGVAGVEFIPYCAEGTLGKVVRVPFGAGSYLARPDGSPLHASRFDDVVYLMRELRAEPFDVVFPDFEVHRQAALVEGRRERVSIRRRRRRDPSEGLLDELARCDGRLSVDEGRASIAELRSVRERVELFGLQLPHMRNFVAHALGYSYACDGLSEGQVLERVLRLFENGKIYSADFVRNPRRARRNIERIIRGIFARRDKRAVGRPNTRPRRRLYEDPLPIHAGDQLLLEQLGLSGLELQVAIDALSWARGNGRLVRRGWWVAPLPLEDLRVRDGRRRAAFNRLLELGLFTLYRPQWLKQVGPNEWKSEATTYRIRWFCTDVGPEITEPVALPPRRRAFLTRKIQLRPAIRRSFVSFYSEALFLPVQGWDLILRKDLSAARAVGGVGNRAAVGPVFQGPVGGEAVQGGVGGGRLPSTPPAGPAPSIAHFEAGPPSAVATSPALATALTVDHPAVLRSCSPREGAGGYFPLPPKKPTTVSTAWTARARANNRRRARHAEQLDLYERRVRRFVTARRTPASRPKSAQGFKTIDTGEQDDEPG